jgi:hypothetical protein
MSAAILSKISNFIETGFSSSVKIHLKQICGTDIKM